MSVQPARGYLAIGEVLAQLQGEFPDVSHSKIRFLETEGLITPARSPSGYRKFAVADVERLRYILSAQRDQYLPLRVIKERLARAEPDADGGAGQGPASRTAAAVRDQLAAGPAAGDGDGTLSRSELVAAAGMTDALLTELETFGLLRRTGPRYGRDALAVARAAAALTGYGVEARHLRSVRAAAERETSMIESLVAPVLRQKSRGARDVAAQSAGELAEHVLALHAALMDATLTEAGLAAAPAPPAAAPPARPADGQATGASA